MRIDRDRSPLQTPKSRRPMKAPEIVHLNLPHRPYPPLVGELLDIARALRTLAETIDAASLPPEAKSETLSEVGAAAVGLHRASEALQRHIEST